MPSKLNAIRIIKKMPFLILFLIKAETHLPPIPLLWWHDTASWPTHLKFIQSLYSRGEAEVPYIAGKRRLPVLIDKNAETLRKQWGNNRKTPCNFKLGDLTIPLMWYQLTLPLSTVSCCGGLHLSICKYWDYLPPSCNFREYSIGGF